MTAGIVEFYFDFISPYSYIAYTLLQRVKRDWGIRIIYKPIRLGRVVKESGNAPPAASPAKGIWLRKDLQRSCNLYGIQFNASEDFFAVPMKWAAHLVIVVQEMMGEDAAERVINALWKEFFGNGNVEPFISGEVSGLTDIIKGVIDGGKIDEILNKMVSEETSNRYQESTNEAFKVGAFGAPTMIVTKCSSGKKDFFFGSDRLNHIAHFLGVEPLIAYSSKL